MKGDLHESKSDLGIYVWRYLGQPLTLLFFAIGERVTYVVI